MYPAFVNAFKPLDDVVVACGAGAIALGFPVVTNETENIFRVPKSLIVQEDVSKFNATSLEARDIKIKITKIDIPVSFASAFEGEIICRGDMQVMSMVPEKTVSSLYVLRMQAKLRITSLLLWDRISTRWKLEANSRLLTS